MSARVLYAIAYMFLAVLAVVLGLLGFAIGTWQFWVLASLVIGYGVSLSEATARRRADALARLLVQRLEVSRVRDLGRAATEERR